MEEDGNAKKLEEYVRFQYGWLDKWNLVAGDPWQSELEKALLESRCCAVFIRTRRLGPWQDQEIDDFHKEDGTRMMLRRACIRQRFLCHEASLVVRALAESLPRTFQA